MTLLARLKERIERRGAITVAEYMEAAATDPKSGYYMTRDPFGKGGDFTTSPEISQVFGELMGAWVASCWAARGSPSPVCLLEFGPGRGTLMADALRATKSVSGFHAALTLYMCEASPVLSALQKRALEGAHPRIRWVTNVNTLPNLPLYFIANEFFDALPIRQWHGKEERKVTLTDDALAFTHPAENITERCETGLSILKKLAAHMEIHGGAGLIVDYGYTGGSRGDTLQAMKNHAYTDVLAAPGEADITAHVDFSALADAAKDGGAAVYGPVPQGVFLRRLGAELRVTALCKNADANARERILSGLARLMSPAEMGELFKVLAVCYPASPPPDGFI